MTSSWFDVRAQTLEAESIDSRTRSTWLSQLTHIASPHMASPEIALLLRTALAAMALRHGGRTLGQALENVRIAGINSNRRQLAVALMWISWAFTPYAWQAVRKRWLPASPAAFGVERALRVAQLFNALLFLWNGHYVSLYARVWRVRMAVAKQGALRNASMAVLNRELVWQGVTELLLVLAPLVDLRRIAALAQRWLSPPTSAAGGSSTVVPKRPQTKPIRDELTAAMLANATQRLHDGNTADSSTTELQLAASSSSSEPCMYCGETVLQRAVLKCCNDAMACYWCASSEIRLGGICLKCKTPL